MKHRCARSVVHFRNCDEANADAQMIVAGYCAAGRERIVTTMPGYTKAQLAKKKLAPAQYLWCRRCRLYWHRRAPHAHKAVSTRKKSRTVANRPEDDAKPLSEEEKRFIDFLVDEAVKHWLAPRADARTRARRQPELHRGARAKGPLG